MGPAGGRRGSPVRRHVTADSEWRTSRVKRAQAAAIASVVSPLVGTLGRTLRWRTEGMEHFSDIEAAGQQPIMAFWHGRILPACYYFRNRGIVVITSQNFDGEWIARVIESFGYGTARGSSSRGGIRALLQLKRDLAEGRPVGFTVDGPRGPACRVQPGAVWLASATGAPVVPFHLEAARHWTLQSWDRTQIPRPFTTVSVVVGKPVRVPEDASAAVLEEFRQLVEYSLNTLEQRALALLERAPVHD